MNDVTGDKINMYLAFKQYLADHNAAWAAVVAFATASTDFNTELEKLLEAVEGQGGDITGAAVDKSQAQDFLVAAMMEVSGPASAYFYVQNDNENAELINFTQSELEGMRDVVLLQAAETLIEKTGPIAVPLVGYGVSALMLTNLGTRRTNFDNKISRPRVKIVERKTHTVNIDAEVKLIDKVLEQRLDNLILGFKTSNPNFVTGYFNARIIVNTGATTSETDISVTGVMNRASDGTPIVGGTVATLDGEHETQTDENGEFALAVPETYAGDLMLKGTATGFTDEEETVVGAEPGESYEVGFVMEAV